MNVAEFVAGCHVSCVGRGWSCFRCIRRCATTPKPLRILPPSPVCSHHRMSGGHCIDLHSHGLVISWAANSEGHLVVLPGTRAEDASFLWRLDAWRWVWLLWLRHVLYVCSSCVSQVLHNAAAACIYRTWYRIWHVHICLMPACAPAVVPSINCFHS